VIVGKFESLFNGLHHVCHYIEGLRHGVCTILDNN